MSALQLHGRGPLFRKALDIGYRAETAPSAESELLEQLLVRVLAELGYPTEPTEVDQALLAVLDDVPDGLTHRAGDPTLDDLLEREQPSPAARRARGA